jgi:RsiW-degrading membrane proteinase PrsW (M82 family)
MKKQPNAWLIFSSLAIQIGVLMYAAVSLGQFLDQKNATSKPWWTLGCCLFGIIVIIQRIIQQTKKL